MRCILSKFYIKPQQRVRHNLGHSCCILSKFYIKPQLFRCLVFRLSVVSYRNSTSNHNTSTFRGVSIMLYLIEILHQTTTARNTATTPCRCILSKFYIKPQLAMRHNGFVAVVSYRNSTSNHNNVALQRVLKTLYLIEILHQTTTFHRAKRRSRRLYLIEILHQTTTVSSPSKATAGLYLIEILHQTTTPPRDRLFAALLYLIEILHQTTTNGGARNAKEALYLIEILHQTTTSGLILIDKVLLTGCLPL